MPRRPRKFSDTLHKSVEQARVRKRMIKKGMMRISVTQIYAEKELASARNRVAKIG